MASIPIYRQDYALSGETPSQQFAGFEPNTPTPALSAVTLASGSAGNTIGKNSTYGDPSDADFKDHKTLFIFKNTSGASTTVTFKAGNTYGARDKAVSIPAGECAIWLDSTKFADKNTGEIKVVTEVASVAAYGIEMR